MNQHTPAAAALAVLTVVVAACSSSVDVTPPETQVIEETTFAASLGVDLSAMTETASGLYYQDFEVGDGPSPEANDSAMVRYAGYLSNGTLFDSADDAIFAVGGVIPGFGEALLGMAEGGVRKAVIPPALGYGDAGRPGRIPGGAILIFDIEILEVNPVNSGG